MFARDVENLLVRTFTHQFESGVRMPVIHLIGSPGTGKSSVVRAAAEAAGAKIKTFILSGAEPCDVRGFGVPRKGPDGKLSEMGWTRSGIIPTEEEIAEGPIVLFLDEYLQSSHDMQKATSSGILEGRFGDVQLPPSVAVVLASNKASDKAGVTRPLSIITNRTCTVEYESDYKSWEPWADRAGISPLIMAWVAQNVAKVFDVEVPANTAEPFLTARELELGNHLLVANFGSVEEAVLNDANRRIATEVLGGCIGRGAATEFMAYAKVAGSLATIEEVMANPDTAKVPDTLDAIYAQAAYVVSWLGEDNGAKLMRYLMRLPPEMQIGTFMRMLKSPHAGALMDTPEFVRWSQKNSALLQAQGVL